MLGVVPRAVLAVLRLCPGIVAAALSGCGRQPPSVVVYTSVDDVFARPILDGFSRETGIRVDAVYDAEAVKTTGLYYRLIAEKSRPRADVFWCSEPSRMLLLEAAGMLASYTPPTATEVPAAWRSPGGAWTGLAARIRVIVYHRDRLRGSAPPRSIADLADPRFYGEAAISDPLFGTMATHAGALRARLGPTAMEEFFRKLKSNAVKVLPGNSVVRDRVASGELLCGLTDSDDASVAVLHGLPIGVVFPDQEAGFPGVEGPLGAFTFPATVGILAGAPHPEAARQLADALLRPATEEALARSESGNLPLREGLEGPQALQVPDPLRRMDVPWPALAQGVEDSIPFLRDLFVR